jgi:hypothetical protein
VSLSPSTDSADRHARRAPAGDSGRPGSETGGGEGTAEESPPEGGVTDETDYFRCADYLSRIEMARG